MNDKMKEVFKEICSESRPYYHVGMAPEDFLDNFLPWNDETPDSYKTTLPGKERTDALLSVPPSNCKSADSMYDPFVKALDQWVCADELECFLENTKCLRFLHSRYPDSCCQNMNVDVATYWQDDLLEDERQSSVESKEGPQHCTSFARQQTHEVFKPSLIYDAFQHELDEDELSDEQEEEENINEGVAGDTQQDNRDVDDEKAAKVPKYKTSGYLGDAESGILTRGQITAYAGLALSMNFRKHFFSMLILGRYARFIRWDRRGAVVTYRFDYTERPELIFKFYRRYGQLLHIQRGFDPSAAQCELPEDVVSAFGRYRDIYGGGDFATKPPGSNGAATQRKRGFCIQVDDPFKESETFYVPSPRYTRDCLMPFHRGSKRSLACLKTKQGAKVQVFFMKDSWQEVIPGSVREAEIYRKLEEAKVEHVASMRLGGDMPNMDTESQKWLGKRFGKMVCHRIVLETVARSLSTFTWCKVLLSCIADAVEGAQQAYKAGILHRDLSAGNIMIVRDAKTGEWRGILIDWDMCLLWKDSELATRSGRIGTWAFMSAKAQGSQGPYMHTLGDDLESAFWVLLYHLLLYTKHNLDPHELFCKIKDLFVSGTVRPNGSLKGGQAKSLVLCMCRLKQSARMLSRFEENGVNRLLNTLGNIFVERYATTEDETNESTMDLDDPGNMWLSTVLRETALKMEPASVTPTALESPTKDSKPPADPKMWKRADLQTQDFFVMPQLADPYASTKAQSNQFDRITSSKVNFLDGLPRKRSRISEADENEPEPKYKKPRRKAGVQRI